MTNRNWWNIPATKQGSGTAIPADAYAYFNNDKPVRLCLRHAVLRRRSGRIVTLASDAPVSGRCADCNESLTVANGCQENVTQGRLL